MKERILMGRCVLLGMLTGATMSGVGSVVLYLVNDNIFILRGLWYDLLGGAVIGVVLALILCGTCHLILAVLRWAEASTVAGKHENDFESKKERGNKSRQARIE